MFQFAEDLGDWPTCQFCFSKFNSRDEWKMHTYEHLTTKQCSDCDVHLIQICDDWFELHTTTKCQSNNHIENNGQAWVEVKQEPIVETESQHLENDSELNVFGEAFAKDFNTASDENDSTIQYSNDYGTQFLDNANPQYTFKVTNVREISNRPKQRNKYQCQYCDKMFRSQLRLDAHFQSHHNSRNQNTCKHCGQTFNSFERLDKHIKRCTFNNKKRKYLRSHPHRPAFDFICDLCNKKLKKFRSLMDHMNEVHLRKSTCRCRICDKLYPSRYYLQKHLNRHKDLFNASGADESIIDNLDSGLMVRKRYRSRLEIQNPVDLTCDECGRQFKHHYSLVEHKSSQHLAKSEFKCRKCDRYYPNR